MLNVWPALPLIVGGRVYPSSDMDNVIAALGQRNRIYEVNLYLANWQWEKVLPAMQVSSLELTDLRFYSRGRGTSPVIPDSFLGGSAPRLRYLWLSSVPFPGLSKLLLSAAQLSETLP